MKKLLYSILIIVSISSTVFGQQDTDKTAADTFSDENLKDNVLQEDLLIETNHDNSNDSSSGASSFSQIRFIPDISLIADVSYVHRNMKDKTFDALEVPEFIHSASEETDAGHSHGAMNAHNGFNLNYAELGFYSAVDPYFDLFAVCHFSPEGAELEEAYFTTLMLPWGFKIKGGKFLSGFGRINEQHAHYLDFAERPLVYRAMFGDEGLNETGMRLSWVAPTDFFLMLAAECLMGENESSFGKDGFTSPNREVDINGTRYPDLYTGNVRSSFDVERLSILLGASGAFGKTRINHGIDTAGQKGHAVKGDSKVVGCDITLRYQFDSVRYVALQSEYLFRHTEGDLFIKDTSDIATISSIDKKQSGLYAQLTGGLAKEWRMGIRYDLLQMNRVKKGGEKQKLPENDPRFSAMIEYKPTEFSRFRIQYNLDRSKYDEKLRRDAAHELIVQANLLIGAHGAHSF